MWKAPHVSLPGSKKLAEKKAKKQVTKRSKPKALKPWDDSVNDLGTYKLSAQELEQRLAKRVSKNRVTVPQSEVQKIKKELSAKRTGSGASEGRFDSQNPKDIPSGWCLDFAAIAEGLKPPPSEDRSSDTPHSHQAENEDPHHSNHCAKSSGNTSGDSSSAESSQEAFSRESISNQSEQMPESDRHPGEGLEDRVNILADVGNRMPKAPSVQEKVMPVFRSPGSIHVTPVASTRNIAPIEKSYERSSGHGDISAIHQMQKTSRQEMDSLRGDVQELRRDMNELKTELKDFVSHYGSMMTTVQSQIQQLLGFRERPSLSASARTGSRAAPPSASLWEPTTGHSNTLNPSVSCGTLEQSYPLAIASTAGYEAAQKLTPTQSDIHPTGGMPHTTPSFGDGPCGGGDSLPSYAQMRRSEIECMTNKSLKEILQPSNERQKVHAFPGSVVIPTTVDTAVGQAPRVAVRQEDSGGDAPSQSSVQAKLRQNVPGPWVRPNTILPQHPVYPTGPRAFAQDLDSTVSLGAYTTGGRASFGPKPKEKGGRYA
ncbi:hypothetical protein BSKO_00940 [Bryopsis sp. KO-2023]|nr:hypothetical protein BSKO_00940 [Bryopsis sp. KO-2023]